MLQSMRELAHSWVAKGLMLFLLASFSIWGIGDIFRGDPLQKTVAKVGNSSISVQQLSHLFEEVLTEARQKIDPNLTAQRARQMGLLDKALQNEIQRQLIDTEIGKLGINVGPESVLKTLAEQPQFRAKDGSFNKQLFAQALQQRGLSEQAFLAEEQKDFARRILLTAFEGNPDVPQVEIDTLYKALAQKRVLDVIEIDTSKIGGIPAPDDKALHEFFDTHPNQFTAPEYRSLTVASLSTDSLAKDIVISDDQVKKQYDSKLDQLAQPEKRNVVQVVLQDEAKAKILADQAHATGDLGAAAKEAKETPIPLDQLEEKNLMPELSKVVFLMHDNEISAPVKTQLGWHVLQLKKIIPANTPSFEQAKDKLRDDMRRDQVIEDATRVVNQLDDHLAAGHSLDDIADELKLRLVKVPAVDAKGVQQNGTQPKEFPNKEDALKEAFAQNAGETSPVEDDKQGTYYVVRTDDIIPSGTQVFDSVKDKVAMAWKAQEQMSKAEAEAQKIAKALGEGKEASSLKEEGLTERSSMPLSQLGDTDPLLPPAVVARALKLKKGETAITQEDHKAIVVRLASITPADITKPDPRKNQVELTIKQGQNDELLDQYLDYLSTVFPVKTNADVLDHMRQQESN